MALPNQYGPGNNDPASGFTGTVEASPLDSQPIDDTMPTEKSTAFFIRQGFGKPVIGDAVIAAKRQSDAEANDDAAQRAINEEIQAHYENVMRLRNSLNGLEAPNRPKRTKEQMTLGQALAGVVGGISGQEGFAGANNWVQGDMARRAGLQDETNALNYEDQVASHKANVGRLTEELKSAQDQLGESQKRGWSQFENSQDRLASQERQKAGFEHEDVTLKNKQEFENASEFTKREFQVWFDNKKRADNLEDIPKEAVAKMQGEFAANAAIYGPEMAKKMADATANKTISEAIVAQNKARESQANAPYFNLLAASDYAIKSANASKAQNDARYAPSMSEAELQAKKLGNQGKAFDVAHQEEDFQIKRNQDRRADGHLTIAQFKAAYPQGVETDRRKHQGVKAGAIAQSQALIQKLGQVSWTGEDGKMHSLSPQVIAAVRSGEMSQSDLSGMLTRMAPNSEEIAKDTLSIFKALQKSDNDIRVADAKLKALGADQGQAIVGAAREMLGKPYVWGSEMGSKSGADCSGLACSALKAAGIDVGRTTADELYKHPKGVKVNTAAEMLPGDLMFWDWKGDGKIDHVGIFQGLNANGTPYFIEASSGKKMVVSGKLNDSKLGKVVGVRRFGVK